MISHASHEHATDALPHDPSKPVSDPLELVSAIRLSQAQLGFKQIMLACVLSILLFVESYTHAACALGLGPDWYTTLYASIECTLMLIFTFGCLRVLSITRDNLSLRKPLLESCVRSLILIISACFIISIPLAAFRIAWPGFRSSIRRIYEILYILETTMLVSIPLLFVLLMLWVSHTFITPQTIELKRYFKTILFLPLLIISLMISLSLFDSKALELVFNCTLITTVLIAIGAVSQLESRIASVLARTS